MARHRTGVLAVGAVTLLLAGSLPAAAQSPAADESPAAAGSPAPAGSPAAGGGIPEDLIAAAQEEGSVTTIALPHDWCNYGGVIQGFKDTFGLEVNELDPDAGSADELEAIRANIGNPGPQAPDVIDVGLAFGPQAKDEELIAPYMVSTWDTIPEAAKDPEGYWYGDYYGVLAFETNLNVQPEPPTDWVDLLDPRFAGQIALAGDPRASNEAIQTVYATALVNGGSLDDPAPGLDFWKQVVDAGNFIPVIANTSTIGQGETPVTVQWSYLALANRDAFAEQGIEIDVTVPASGAFAGIYAQAVSAHAPHPNAARLWMEYLYSDDGQLKWLEGYCYPIRFDDLVARGVVPEDLLARLPAIEGAIFPSLEQLENASAVITEGWDTVVGVDYPEAE
jgi:putative spermidine/putrescine transport system substrate-binding protein